jgi:DNA (cytosine-5)-methyltransferase 1
MGLDNQHINAGAPLFVLENQPISFGIQGNIIGRQDHNGGNGTGFSEEICGTLTKADQHGVAVIHGTQDPCASDIAFALGRNNGQENALIEHSQVRRLTPVECARLQGFPDNYLDIIYGRKPAADGPKYKALGNSMAVPVMAWIGSRIKMVDEVAA